jgi:hypothetical protein
MINNIDNDLSSIISSTTSNIIDFLKKNNIPENKLKEAFRLYIKYSKNIIKGKLSYGFNDTINIIEAMYLKEIDKM